MTVQFPDTTFTILRSQAISEEIEQRVLMIGQKQASGTAVAGALTENISESASDINTLFGARSILAEMVREFKKINEVTRLDVIALDDNPAGVIATSDIVFTGTATAAGSLFVEIGSGTNFRFKVDIAVGDTAAVVAGKLETLIDAKTTSPFTASLATATVTVSAANAGTVANDWSIFVDGAVAGISISISAFSAGANAPVLSNLFTPVQNRRYQTVVYQADLTAADLLAEMDARFNVSNDVLQGVAFVTNVGTAAESVAAAAAFGSQSVVVIGSKAISTTELVGSAHREFPDVISARVAAVRSLRFTEGALLSSILATAAPADQVGGRALASLPYANTILPNMPIIRAADQFTTAELTSLEAGGVSVVGANPNFSRMVLDEMLTTNLTDAGGNADTTFKFLTTVDTVAAVRDAHFFNFRRRYAQSRLTDGALEAGRSMANKESIEAFGDEILASLQDDVLVQSGAEAIADNKATRVVLVDVAAGRVDYRIAPLLVGGLRVIIGTITVNFIRS